jgi:hypothetical protein
MGCTTLCKLKLVLIDAPVCVVSWCVDAPRVSVGPTPRVDPIGKPACELCGRRLSKVKHHRPHDNGRACSPRCKPFKHDSDATSLPATVPAALSHHRTQPDSCQTLSPLSPTIRSKRPYHTLRPTQRWERRKRARQVLQQLGVPLQALHPPSTPSPAELIHLPTSVREQIRSVPSLHIPCEQTMIQCKQQLSHSHATETGTFAGGSFITDPLRFVSVLCAQSSFLAVGGDAGGGRCVLGVTYSIPTPTEAKPEKTTQYFACLLVYEGGDSWLELQDCRAEGLTAFVGDSAAFPHIWAVLQHLIDTRSAFLNGDWCFINAVLGLMAPAATHPCPICIVSHKSFTKTARYRTPADKHSLDRTHSPLLTIPPERIVPTPLHLFLGISNRIILDVYKELFGEAVVLEAVERVKTVHTAGCGGLSDLYDLNGPEISKWVKKECSQSILAAADAASSVPAPTRASHSVFSHWLTQLHASLLHSGDWSPADIDVWRSVVSDIHQHWCAETSQAAFPKLHMLHHTVDFAERYRFLGRASEAQIESTHATFNTLFHKQHRNQSSNTAERLRRSLADATLRAVQPFINPDSTTTESHSSVF